MGSYVYHHNIEEHNKKVAKQKSASHLDTPGFLLNTGEKSRKQAKIGKTVVLDGQILNTGGVVKGLKFELTGSLIKDGILDKPQPEKTLITVKGSGLDLIPKKEKLTFTKQGDSLLAKVSDVDCFEKTVNVSIPMKVLKPGDGDIELIISSLESGQRAEIARAFKLKAYQGKQ